MKVDKGSYANWKIVDKQKHSLKLSYFTTSCKFENNHHARTHVQQCQTNTNSEFGSFREMTRQFSIVIFQFQTQVSWVEKTRETLLVQWFNTKEGFKLQ